ASLPLVMLMHGLSGTEESVYVRATAAHLLRQGHSVLRLNLRGAGVSATRCRGRYHAGRSEDLRQAIAALSPALVGKGIVPVGYSLGGNVLLKLLGEGGHPDIRAAAAVSAPIDLAAASRCLRLPRNHLYQSWLLTMMRVEAMA